jgi:branched-subunit amino acid transport protein AzlD
MTVAKLLIILFLFAIIFVLFRGLYYMVKDQGKTKKTVNSLTWRIGLSVMLIILLIIGASFGYIQPHGVQP